MTVDKLSIELELIAQEYENGSVRVIVVKDYGKLRVDGAEYSLTRGVEIEVPRWLASILEDEGIANQSEPGISIEDITRVHFSVMSARTPAELEPLPRDFYQEALRYLERLAKRVRKEFNASLLEEHQKASQYLAEILDRRLSLILQSLRSPAALAEISASLSKEETALLDALRGSIDTWRKRLAPRPLLG